MISAGVTVMAPSDSLVGTTGSITAPPQLVDATSTPGQEALGSTRDVHPVQIRGADPKHPGAVHQTPQMMRAGGGLGVPGHGDRPRFSPGGRPHTGMRS